MSRTLKYHRAITSVITATILMAGCLLVGMGSAWASGGRPPASQATAFTPPLPQNGKSCSKTDFGQCELSCEANDNLGEIANDFISRCRQGGIRREFPGELYSSTLGVIAAGNARPFKTAWKLLNDGRFRK